jgi:hypothetical protein
MPYYFPVLSIFSTKTAWWRYMLLKNHTGRCSMVNITKEKRQMIVTQEL